MDKDSIVYSDKWRAYNGLIDLGYRKHYRLDHDNDEFAVGNAHINGIEGFWRTIEEDLLQEINYDSEQEFKEELLQYLYYYNFERPHQGINELSPNEFIKTALELPDLYRNDIGAE